MNEKLTEDLGNGVTVTEGHEEGIAPVESQLATGDCVIYMNREMFIKLDAFLRVLTKKIMKEPMYVGDGVYVKYSNWGGQIVIYTSDGITESNHIYLEREHVITIARYFGIEVKE